MYEMQPPDGEPQVRFIVTCPHGGSTFLMTIFQNHPLCAVTDASAPQYLSLEDLSHHSAFTNSLALMIPRDDKHEMLFTPSPYARARPIILIRDSIRVFDDWKQIGWGDPKSLIKYYTTMFPLLSRAPANTASSLLYEKLTQAPREGVQHICQHWGVPFSEQIFASTEIDTPYHGLPSNMEKTENWGAESTTQLQAVFAGRSRVGFDLDDTLHEFRRGSGNAVDQSPRRYLCATQHPRHIAKDGGNFSRRAGAFRGPPHDSDSDSGFTAEIQELCEAPLSQSLEPKCGALSLPIDAQERTVQRLDIGGYVDFIAPTNRFGVAKTGGLFARVLKYFGD
ncbi:HAD-like domain-containing protein [Hypoxylon fragiforme]|uniref:HAD-like domain-containing protein n=1 Tax=Hypoxylon fragiforme TaxID=63214 RepID=UPI0020C6CF4D|nr:HAD-like domain-containing protein [Hypoxylon fragiforme]KAI2603234.1 HAD-like domain-containing protein [Hypoxylon fragiforme]